MTVLHVFSSPEHEQIATQWIKWLSKEEAHYEAASGVHASFGEILLLIAIHFHASQVDAITELVCSVLGMNIRLGSLTRMKTLFTEEIFPEKVCEQCTTVAHLVLLSGKGRRKRSSSSLNPAGLAREPASFFNITFKFIGHFRVN